MNSSSGQQRTALVTGGGGFLGRYIVEQLQNDGWSVRILARGQYPDLAAQGVDVRRGDIRSVHDVEEACRGIDTVFHVAAVPGVWGPLARYAETNILGTENVLNGCLRHGVARLVYTSSPSVVYDGSPHENADESLPYPNSYLCHYPRTKAAAEQAVLRANGREGLGTCALRPHLIWGPRDNHLIPRLLERADSGRLRRVGGGRNRVSLTYVENAAAAHLQAARALRPGAAVAGRAYFINDLEPVTLWDWINDVLRLAGRPAVSKSISAANAYRLGACCEWVYQLLRLGGEPPMTRFVAKQLAESHTYSVAAAQRDFGYEPPVSPAEALSRLASWLKELRRNGPHNEPAPR